MLRIRRQQQLKKLASLRKSNKSKKSKLLQPKKPLIRQLPDQMPLRLARMQREIQSQISHPQLASVRHLQARQRIQKKSPRRQLALQEMTQSSVLPQAILLLPNLNLHRLQSKLHLHQPQHQLPQPSQLPPLWQQAVPRSQLLHRLQLPLQL